MCFVIYMLTYGCKSEASHASTYNTSKAEKGDEGEGKAEKDKGEGKDESKDESKAEKGDVDLRSFDTLQ